jgi:hypothetical protein
MEQRTQIGYFVGGGLKENFRVRLTVSPQEMQEGAFVVIQSGEWNYYGIVTDINSARRTRALRMSRWRDDSLRIFRQGVAWTDVVCEP